PDDGPGAAPGVRRRLVGDDRRGHDQLSGLRARLGGHVPRGGAESGPVVVVRRLYLAGVRRRLGHRDIAVLAAAHGQPRRGGGLPWGGLVVLAAVLPAV